MKLRLRCGACLNICPVFQVGAAHRYRRVYPGAIGILLGIKLFFVGLIMLIGMVAKNGILLLDADEKFRAAGFSRAESIFQAGRRRLRPIVMTAIAAVVGMLPLALAIGAGSQMLQPLADRAALAQLVRPWPAAGTAGA